MEIGKINGGPSVQEFALSYANQKEHPVRFIFYHNLGDGPEEVDAVVNTMGRCPNNPDTHILHMTLFVPMGLFTEGGEEKFREMNVFVEYDAEARTGAVFDSLDD